MERFLLLALLASVACKWLFGRWPWQYLLVVPASARARAQALLGVPAQASREEIIAAHKRLLFEVHPDRGGSEALVHEANAARDLLLARLPDARTVR